MRTPSFDDLTLDPERALLHTLDVAAAMTISMMQVFFPVDDTRVPQDRGLYLISQIIRDARTLRTAIADYRDHLDNEDGDSTFPF